MKSDTQEETYHLGLRLALRLHLSIRVIQMTYSEIYRWRWEVPNFQFISTCCLGILFSPISGAPVCSCYVQSKNEFEADAYAKETFNGTALSDALKRLSVDSLSDLYPHPLYVFFHYSHPPYDDWRHCQV
jgi:hypothetical protein